MRMLRSSLRLAALLSGAAALQLACTSVGSEVHPSLTKMWRQYRQLPRERALAIAGDLEYLWVGAAVGGYPSRAEAERGAIEECKKRRVQRRMQSPCRLYAVGDKIVWKSW